MIDTIQTAGPYVLAFWFGAAFGFVVCAFFAGGRILVRQASMSMIYGTMYENQQGWQFAVRPGYDATDPWYKGFYRKPREKLASDLRTELAERVAGSGERPRTVRAHE